MNIQTLKPAIPFQTLQERTAQRSEASAAMGFSSDQFESSRPEAKSAPTVAEMKAFFEPPKARELKMSRLPDIPTPARSSFGVARSGSKVYVVGGHQGREHTYPPESFMDQLEVFDLETNAWTTLAPRPVKAHGYGVVSDGPFVYAFGGFTYSDEHKPKWKSIPDVHRYDSRSNEWEKVGELKDPRSSNAVVQVGRKVYMVGGWNGTPKHEDDYEGDFTSRRVLLYTFRFTAKTYLFGPASNATKDIIKKATVSYLTGTDTSNTTREVSYSSTPRAIKNYTGDAATTLTADITISVKTFDVADGSTLTKGTYIDIDGEEMFIKSISGNKITVNRGQDGSTITTHLGGASIHKIDAADDALIEVGDDFGFSGGI